MKILTKTAAVVVLALPLLAACGSDKPAAPSTSTSTSGELPVTAPVDGCTETATDELYVAHLFTCDRGTSVYVFNDATAKGNWWQIASQMGGVKVSEGDTWLEVKQ